MRLLNAFAGGLTAACAITALHQFVKYQDKDAPRMDLLGMESITKILQKMGIAPPEQEKLYYITMGGDIFSNAIFYSLTGLGKRKTWLKGSGLGLAAGLGAVLLPKPMGLNEQHSNRTRETQLLSVLYYLAGGLVSAGVVKLLEKATTSKAELVKQKLEAAV
jgi:hypothetical protein